MNTGNDLPDHKTVLRVVKRIEQFIPVGATLPTWLAFNPSSKDFEEAQVRGLSVRVSVWDTEFTSVQQAQGFRQDAELNEPYGLLVGEARGIALAVANTRFRVVADPLIPSRGPGSEGHCGIEGLDRSAGTPKKIHQAFLVDLAKRCFPLCAVCSKSLTSNDHATCAKNIPPISQTGT
jgi:hypothetical protein